VITEWLTWAVGLLHQHPGRARALALTRAHAVRARPPRLVDVVGAALATGGLTALCSPSSARPSRAGARRHLLVGAAGLLALALFVALQSGGASR
jgi:hypothetical protein